MKKSLFALSVILTFILMTGCSFTSRDTKTETDAKQQNSTIAADQNTGNNKLESTEVNLYFPTEDNSAVPVEKRIIQMKDKAIVNAVVEELLKGPETKGLKRAIPDGTKLIDAYTKDKVAVVNFSGEYTKVGDIAKIVERISVVNTLTALEGIDRVKILVEGKELTGPSGMPFGELSKAALDDQGRPIPVEMKQLKLFFGNDNADALIEEDREVYINDNAEKAVIEELIKGPTNSRLSSPIPKGTRLLSVETKDGICKLNFSKEFVDNHPGGSAGERMTIYSIVNSLTELENVKSVQFLIEGEKREVYIHVVFDQPIGRDEDIIEK